MRIEWAVALFLLGAVGCTGAIDVNNGDDPDSPVVVAGDEGGPGGAANEPTSGGGEPGGGDEVPDGRPGGDAPGDAPGGGDEPEPDPDPTTDLTYHRDVRPILEASCNGCHQEGEIGTYLFDTYEQVYAVRTLIEYSVSRREMPPWPPASGCGDFRHERTLSEEQIRTITDWVEGGAPEGDEADYVPPTTSSIPDLGTPDMVVELEGDYRPEPPNGRIDDYRCFYIPVDFGAAGALRGFEVVPTNREIAHHASFWVLPDTPENREELERRDAEDPGMGYSCFGGPGVADVFSPSGVWTPGDVPAEFVPGTGVELPSRSLFVVQMHYNIVNDREGSDRTQFHLYFEPDGVETELVMAPLFDRDLFLPAGVAEVRAGIGQRVPQDVVVYGYMPHMHLLGTRIRLTVDDTCLIDIPSWDFGWQGTYYLEEPFVLPAGSEVRVDCWYDNSEENQPEGRMPRDVTFGEGTYDEMCGVGIIIGAP